MQEQKISILEHVSETRYSSMFALRTLFGEEEIRHLEPWIPVIKSLQVLPQQLVKDAVDGIVSTFFEEENLDPKSPRDRDIAANFAPVIAQSIDTMGHAVFEQMQRDAAKDEKTKRSVLSGRGGVLR